MHTLECNTNKKCPYGLTANMNHSCLLICVLFFVLNRYYDSSSGCGNQRSYISELTGSRCRGRLCLHLGERACSLHL